MQNEWKHSGCQNIGVSKGRKRFVRGKKKGAELKKKVEGLNLSYWMTCVSKRRVERFWKVVSLLQENSRMTLTEISGKLKIPVSTLYDTLKEVEKIFQFTIVLKESERNAPLRNITPLSLHTKFL